MSKNENIKVCRFDKGNGVVILDSDDYFDKLDNIVLDQTKFQEVQIVNDRHPIIANEITVQNYLRTKVKPHIGLPVYKHLYPAGSQPGRLYGMCKVHKNGYPLRPVISMLNTAEYKLGKWLDEYIKPNIPCEFSVASTDEFLNELNDAIYDPRDKMVSFDVTSLYTNIPLTETINLVVDRLYSEKSVKIPPFPKAVFKRLLEIATGGMFIYKDKLYKQVDGVAMGSPLGPSLANFFLGYIEENTMFEDSSVCPKVYLRYVDDIFAVFGPGTSYHPFFQHLNQLHTNLKFTVEEAKGCFPFLEVEIKIVGETVETWIYRKKTHTGVMLNFSAAVPDCWKMGLIRCLLHRARRVCSTGEYFDREVNKLRSMFHANGYPKMYFDRAVEKFKAALQVRANPELVVDGSQDSEVSERKYIFGIPYVGTASKEYKKRINALVKECLGVDISSYYTSCKISEYFSLKSKVPFALKANVVYKYSCLVDPDTSYIGKTKRHLVTRVQEHTSTTESQKSEVKDHIFNCRTCKMNIPDLSSFKIMKSCRDDYTTRISEALLIKKFRPKLNKQIFTKGQSYLLRVF